MSKHTSYYELRDALAAPGCALCRLVQRGVQRFLDFLVYEKVNDPQVRHEVRQARGFCNLHAWQLVEQRGALSIAILHRDVLQNAMRILQEGDLKATPASALSRVRATLGAGANSSSAEVLASRLAAQERCPACRLRERVEGSYSEVLLEYIDDPAIVAGFREGDGLCLPHLRQVLQRTNDAAAAQKLIVLELETWERLRGELDEFIRKQDYRFHDESLGDEGDSWIRAVAQISGEQGVW